MTHSIDFILFQNVLGLDVLGPLEVFNTATEFLRNESGSELGYVFRFVAETRGMVRMTSGLSILADTTFDETSGCDTLIVPGGSGALDIIHDRSFIGKVRRKAASTRRIMSVCNGSFILAEAGLLHNRRATTHWASIKRFRELYPDIISIEDAIYTRDGNIYSSGGVTAGIDCALALVKEDYGPELALKVSRYLLLYFQRPGNQSQFSSPLRAQEAAGKEFAHLHDWLVSNLQDTISVDEMAGFCAMSPRNFSRIFKAKTGITPARYLETLRLDRAKELLSSGTESLEEVAIQSGFHRLERLRRAFQRAFNVTPSNYRIHF